MKLCKKIISFFILTCLVYTTSFAQSLSFPVELFRIENGLSQNTVNSVYIDTYGFLWVGTQDGLNKYDGYKFQKFRHRPEEKEITISNNFIRTISENKKGELMVITPDGVNTINRKTGNFTHNLHLKRHQESKHKSSALFSFQDKKGIIWFATENGLDMYNPKTHKAEYFEHSYGELSNRSQENKYTLSEDKNGILWMGSKSGLVSFNKVTHQFNNYLPFDKSEISKNEVTSVYIAQNGIIWVGTQAGFFKFKDKKFYRIPPPTHKENVKNANQINTIYEDSRGLIWVGTKEGLFSYNEKKSSLNFIVLNDKQNHDLSRRNILSLTQDRSEILWIGTNTGLVKLNLKKLNFQLHRKSFNDESFSSKKIYSIFAKDENTLWLGTRGQGLNSFNTKTGKVVIYSNENFQNHLPDKENEVSTIYKDNDSTIWIGTMNGIFIYEESSNKFIDFLSYFKTGLKSLHFDNNRVMEIIQDRKGNYWFASKNGLFMFNKKQLISFFYNNTSENTISSNQTVDVIEDFQGHIWIATENGLNRYNHDKKSFDLFTNEYDGLSNNSILSLFQSSDSTLWIGTETGLNWLSKKSRSKDGEREMFSYYTEANGLTNDFIYCIEEDKFGIIWVSTNKGVSSIDPSGARKDIIHNFDISDGLQAYEFNIGSSYNDSKSEKIYFGGVNGFNSFSPSKILSNPYTPEVMITHFSKAASGENKETRIPENHIIELEPNENSFRIDFRVLEFTMPKKNKFKYRLLGLGSTDTVWISTYDNFASYPMIPSGDYTFEVMGANNDEIWNKKPATLQINIATPLHKTYAAYIVYLTMGVFFILFIINLYATNTRNEKVRNIQIKEKNDELRAQQEVLKDIVKETNDSITYASRIITAMMPSEAYFKKLLPQSFIYFKPKSVVSGDFYWIEKRGDIIITAAVDCTGHGVPGAFMSIVGMNLLRTIIDTDPKSPAEILNLMNKSVTKIFEQKTKQELSVSDGMDMSLCMINVKAKKLQFAGAKNPLYIMRNSSLTELKADRFSIGPDYNSESQSFNNHTFDLEEDDVLYMFSDGFVDQFGGEKGKKFKFRKFRRMLLMMHEKSPEIQKDKIHATFTNWTKGYEQIDDILILGIKPLQY